jgi:hypothetical protein
MQEKCASISQSRQLRPQLISLRRRIEIEEKPVIARGQVYVTRKHSALPEAGQPFAESDTVGA